MTEDRYIELGVDGITMPEFLKSVQEILDEIPAESRENAKVSLWDNNSGRYLAIEWSPPPPCEKTLDMFR